jgi:hypothetical protein
MPVFFYPLITGDSSALRRAFCYEEIAMWKQTGERVVVGYDNGKLKYARIETNGKHARLVRE